MDMVHPMHLELQEPSDTCALLSLATQLTILLDAPAPSKKRCFAHHDAPEQTKRQRSSGPSGGAGGLPHELLAESASASHSEAARQHGRDEEARLFLQGPLPPSIPCAAMIAAVEELPQGARSAFFKIVEAWRSGHMPEAQVLAYARSVSWQSPTLKQCLWGPCPSSGDDAEEEEEGEYEVLSPSELRDLMSCASTQSSDSMASFMKLSGAGGSAGASPTPLSRAPLSAPPSRVGSFNAGPPRTLSSPRLTASPRLAPSRMGSSPTPAPVRAGLEGLVEARGIVSDAEELDSTKTVRLSELFQRCPEVARCFLGNSWDPLQRHFSSTPDWLRAGQDLSAL